MFSACTFKRSINQISPRSLLLHPECKSHYGDRAQLLLAVRTCQMHLKRGGVWVGTCMLILVDWIVPNGLSQWACPGSRIHGKKSPPQNGFLRMTLETIWAHRYRDPQAGGGGDRSWDALSAGCGQGPPPPTRDPPWVSLIELRPGH
ncbi:hypothetical protein MG293_017854 [Ovis ammon polii]|uniref:Uncharacterized protein n=1 Tax=Ovis ammon polii TaxID=230172 RepID=A0AAD4TUG0_OVIAM|nr:hypothetical protein MG293_017854 [Ovis ammon polii]KAI4553564.1 hypothetical protein MJT46_015744 [Ovis ammon polii x Ovis aries]